MSQVQWTALACIENVGVSGLLAGENHVVWLLVSTFLSRELDDSIS
jgi:hypothetical protein